MLVEEWQQACCGRPFAVGEHVKWRLGLDTDNSLELPDGLLRTTNVVAGPMGTKWEGRHRALVRVGGLTAEWYAPSPEQGAVTVRGYFTEDHHDGVPSDVPETVGKVMRMHVAYKLSAPLPSRTPDAGRDDGMTRLVPVESSLQATERPPAAEALRVAAGARWSYTGWLVDLEV